MKKSDWGKPKEIISLEKWLKKILKKIENLKREK